MTHLLWVTCPHFSSIIQPLFLQNIDKNKIIILRKFNTIITYIKTKVTSEYEFIVAEEIQLCFVLTS